MKKYFFAVRAYLIIGFIGAILVILFDLLSPGVVNTLEDGWLNIAYRVRGSSDIDTSIVVMYIEGDDIKALGGLPLKRSYYALLANVLHEKGAKAIGFDLAFSESNSEYKDHDRLFASVVQSAGNVVISGYFHSISSQTLPNSETKIPSKNLLPINDKAQWLHGYGFDPPYQALVNAAAGIGHSHLNERNSIPLFIVANNQLLPSFAFELIRVSTGTVNNKIKFSGNNAILSNGDNNYSFPFDENGNINLNYSGGIKSLRLTSVVEFLKLSNHQGENDKQSEPQISVQEKIVLIGIVAEGRSKFIKTPFTEEFPTIGVHAMILHNAIKGNFLKYTGQNFAILSILIFSLIAGVFISMQRDMLGLTSVFVMVILYLCLAFFLFSFYNIIISITLPIAGVVFSVISGIFYKHQSMKKKVRRLSEEKAQFMKELSEKQSVVENLQTVLSRNVGNDSASNQHELKAQIQKYEEEISKLRMAAMDYQPASDIETKDAGIVKIFEGIVYNSQGPMQGVISLVQKIAESNATVLIQGESGTGKELIARALHARSERRSKAFIPVNCGALTETLLESELFGHEKGAFTGALKERAGRFELADGGTIFLDEMGDTSEAFQVKLLRILQDGTFERVGGNTIKKVDVRVIAATNKDLKQSVLDKKFREDLYYRLNVLNINLPPLRNRKSDIPLLVNHFLSQESNEIQCSQGVINVLGLHQWRGNIRELQSVIRRAIIFAKSDGRILLQLRDFPDEIIKNNVAMFDFEEQIPVLVRAKNFSRNSISETAQELGGVNRGTVAEYFRGYCLKMFFESGWNIEKTISAISGSDDELQNKRVRKKIIEYFNNAVELVISNNGIAENIKRSKAKYKNLPQKYHTYLDKTIESYCNKLWDKFE